MIIAKQKRRENIAEYILYMWQLEDLLRACNLDIETVKQKIIAGYKADKPNNIEITGWYESLIHMIRSEGIDKAGHMQLVKNTLNEVNELHLKLLAQPNQVDYGRAFINAKSNITLFRTKSNNIVASDIEICFNALYSLLLMKISGKEIHPETIQSMESFSNLLSLLAHKFNEWESGKLEL